MISAGTVKVLNLIPAEAVAKMESTGLGDKLLLIGCGEIIAAVLMVIPWTSPLGVLATSGFWGGVICFHITHQEDYLAGSAFLALTWLGGYLRGSVPLLALPPARPQTQTGG